MSTRQILRALPILLLLAAAAPASAEIYRWTDAEGREHFTMDLHRVPAKHRGEAERRMMLEKIQVEPKPDPVNSLSTPDRVRVKRALRPRRSYAAPPPAAGSTGCASWQRSKAQKLEARIANYEKKVELYESKQRRLVRLEDRMRAENSVERYEIYLEQAEEEYENFLSDMRQKGVPPGCLR